MDEEERLPLRPSDEDQQGPSRISLDGTSSIGGPLLASLHDGPGSPRFRRVQYALYASYFLAAWAWRGMEFTVALVLIDLYPESLLLVSLYGLLDNGMRVMLGGSVGSYIDRSGRWQGARDCYVAQNACVCGAGAALAAVLAGWAGEPGHPDPDQAPRYWALVCLALALSSSSSVGSTGIMIAVERRMPKLLCTSSPSNLATPDAAAPDSDPVASAALSRMNSVFRAIDLVCLLVSPMLSGFVMTYLSPLAAVLVLTAYCLLAWAPELALLRWAIHASPALHQQALQQQQQQQADAGTTTPPTEGDISAGAAPTSAPKPLGKAAAICGGCASGWLLYFRQPVLLANLALAMLYMTVLSLGFLMTSYLKWAGMTEAEISLFRGGGAVAGLLATALFPWLHGWLGLIRTGLLGITYQLVCLSVGVLPVVWATLATRGWLPTGWGLGVDGGADDGGTGAPGLAQVRLLIGTVVASRTGLWMFDLAITQIVQERVSPGELGVVCGVQTAVQACFETASFLAGTFLRDPAEFWGLMAGSLGLVAAATVLFAIYALKGRREHGYEHVATREQRVSGDSAQA